MVSYISLHYCIRKSTIIARKSYLCLGNRHICCNITLCTLVLHSDIFTSLTKMKLRWTERPPVMQWQPCCSTEIFDSLVLGILFLGKKQQSQTNNLVSCQVDRRRMQYLRCGNLWRNIGKNRKNCTWYL